MTLAADKSSVLELAERCRVMPGYYHKHVLKHEHVTRDQRRLIKASMNNRFVAAASAHGTGKSNVLAGLALMFMAVPQVWVPSLPLDATVRVVMTASTSEQIHDVFWPELTRQYHRASPAVGGTLMKSGYIESASRSLVTISPKEPESAQGKHAAAQLILIDEAEHLDAQFANAFESCMTGENEWMVLCYNPLRLTGYVPTIVDRSPLYHHIRMSGLDHPNVIEGREIIPGAITRRYIRDKLLKEAAVSLDTPWEEIVARLLSDEWKSNPEIMGRILGIRAAGATDQVITREMLVLTHAGVRIDNHRSDMHAGIDVAHGGDFTALSILDEHQNVVFQDKIRSDDFNEMARWARAKCEPYKVKPTNIHVEADGLGDGLIDAFKTLGMRVHRVSMGGSPSGAWKDHVGDVGFSNQRAELWWTARALLKQSMLSIPERYSNSWEDLQSPRFGYDAKQQIKIEAKDSIKRRLGRSPDEGESIILALARKKAGGLGVA